MYGWQRYLSIEQEFAAARYYVSFSVGNAYSEFFTREVILLGVEIEAAFKELCRRINNSTPGNMGDYKSIILGTYPRIVDIYVSSKETGQIFYPFRGWDTGHLSWWDVYVQVKHNLVDQAATLDVALTMLQAYEILLFCIAATSGNFSFNYLDNPKLFTPGFEPGMSVINMQIVMDYYGEDIISKLTQ